MMMEERIYFQLYKGKRYRKSELKGQLHKIRLNNGNSMKFFSILQKAGYVEVKGKSVFIKKNLQL
jgi:hypothetical protein